MNRRRSLTVAAPLLAAAAFSITTGCNRQQADMQRCVDEHDNVVADNLCQNTPGNPIQTRTEQRPDGHGDFFPVFIPLYRPYYGGMGGYGIGSHVYGGGYTATPGRSYASPSVTRGGFGHFFSGGGE